MKSIQLFTLVLGFTAALAACSNGGRSRVVGSQCPASYNPVPMDDVKPEQKLWSKGQEGDESKIPAGTYSVEKVELYYVDKSDLRVSVVEIKDRAGNFKAQVNCVRNARKSGLQSPGVKAQGAIKLITANGAPMQIETKDYGFTINQTKIVAQATPAEKTDKLSGVYNTSKASDYFFMKHNDVDYEIRSKGVNENGTYYLSVKLKKQ